MAEPKIIKEWETAEINPQEIAKYLHGVPEESDDAQSNWNIHLYYGGKNPVITIKLDTELRTIYLLVHRPRKGHYLTIETDIKSLDFHLYRFRGKEHCDLKVEGSESTIILSSYCHFNYFGKKEDREAVRKAFLQGSGED